MGIGGDRNIAGAGQIGQHGIQGKIAAQRHALTKTGPIAVGNIALHSGVATRREHQLDNTILVIRKIQRVLAALIGSRRTARDPVTRNQLISRHYTLLDHPFGGHPRDSLGSTLTAGRRGTTRTTTGA